MKTDLIKRLRAEPRGPLCDEAANTITRLQGEAGVMRELLRLAHGVIDTIEPEDCYESEKLIALLNEIQAVLKAGVTA
jgi:hypothetical protein